ncbi:hypothetical protein E4U42_003484 [Claviceps africana]|uniref:ACB domain-containing protein n=1 Tax=Claviceps africana TaxID=83212 RepID=A0A8K0J703_9HYPO|nr:hypothetical protein E4U42_003484 [Claviceps africana]
MPKEVAETGNAAFDDAANNRAPALKDLDRDGMLQLYGLYKTALGKDFSKETKPGLLSGIPAKLKYEAWKKVVDRGLSAKEAQDEYVAKVEEFEKAQS